MARRFLIITICLMLIGCSTAPPAPARPTALPSALPPAQLASRSSPEIAAIAERRAAIAAALANAEGLLFAPGIDEAEQALVRKVLQDAQVRAATALIGSDEPLLSEVFAVQPSAPRDGSAACATCVTITLYTYALDTTTTIISDAAGQVQAVTSISGAQPEVPPHLADLALAIMVAAPETSAALGVEPSAEAVLMAATKTHVIGTVCERSRHLCVAPTIVWGEQALWGIVDLTDLALIGLEWTPLGTGARAPLSERSLQTAAVAELCDRAVSYERGAWSFDLTLTASDGLAVRNLRYNGAPLFGEISVVDWHVQYPTTDGRAVGYADAVGCPVFSNAAVVPFEWPQISAQPDGSVVIAQDFRSDQWPNPCNYRYAFQLTLGTDGSISPEAINIGRGCGLNGIYRPIVRAIIAQPLAANAPREQQWEAGQFPGLNLGLADGQILALSASAADRAFVYLSGMGQGAGSADLASIGGCCSETIAQGPEQFLNGEALAEQQAIIWYIPQIQAAERAACWAEPRIAGGVRVTDEWPCGAGPHFRVIAP